MPDEEVQMIIELQPPAVAQVDQQLRPRLSVSIDGSADCDFITACLQDTNGTVVNQLGGGVTNTNPEPFTPAEGGSSSQQPRQYTVFRDLSIHAVGRYVIYVAAQKYDALSQSYTLVACATTEVIDVQNRAVAATKPTPAQKALIKDLHKAGFF